MLQKKDYAQYCFAADFVAGLIENTLSPTTRYQTQDGLQQLKDSLVRATQSFAVPMLEDFLVPEVNEVVVYAWRSLHVVALTYSKLDSTHLAVTQAKRRNSHTTCPELQKELY